MKFLKNIPYPILIIACIFLGMAPFVPQPHLVEKIAMLLNGSLTRPVDIFDLIMHGSPVVLLLAKILVERRANP